MKTSLIQIIIRNSDKTIKEQFITMRTYENKWKKISFEDMGKSTIHYEVAQEFYKFYSEKYGIDENSGESLDIGIICTLKDLDGFVKLENE